jgi:hypothetical protein
MGNWRSSRTTSRLGFNSHWVNPDVAKYWAETGYTLQCRFVMTVSPLRMAEGLADSRNIGGLLQRMSQAYGEIQSVREQLDALTNKLGKDTAENSLLVSVDALRSKTKPLVSDSGETSLNLHAMNDALAAIATDVEGADRAPTSGQQQALAEYQSNLDKALGQWQTIRATDLPELNGQLHDAGIATITVPTPGKIHIDEPGESQDMP